MMKPWILPSLISLFCWSLWAFFPKITIRYIPVESALVYEVCGGVIVSLFVLFTIGFNPGFHGIGSNLALLTGIFGFLGAYFYLMAVKSGPVSLIVIVTALYPVITIALAWYFLNESFSPKQIFGIIFGLLAIYLLTS